MLWFLTTNFILAIFYGRQQALESWTNNIENEAGSTYASLGLGNVMSSWMAIGCGHGPILGVKKSSIMTNDHNSNLDQRAIV